MAIIIKEYEGFSPSKSTSISKKDKPKKDKEKK